VHTETLPAEAFELTPARQRLLAGAIVVVVAFSVRVPFFHYQSGDYTGYFGQWFNYINTHGGFRALKTNFSNYNAPYLYLLAILTYTPVAPLLGIKLVSIAFDYLLAYFVYRIVELRRPDSWWPLLAGAITLFLPTVMLNSAMWAQCDSIYSSLSIGGLYFALRRRPWLTCIFFGLGFSFKLQAIFIFPVLLLLVLRRFVPWRALLLIPLTYLVMELPALAVGASPHTLLTVYTGQTDTYSQLSLNAPNIYQFFGADSTSHTLRTAGILVTGAVLLILLAAAVRSRVELTPTRIVLAAMLSVIVVPYLLPGMHERYFYLADALTVIAAFYVPWRLMLLPVLEQFASAFSYAPFLRMSMGRPGGGARFARPNFTGQRPRFGGGGPPPAGNSRPGRGFGGGGGAHTASQTLVSFPILSAAMLAAVILACYATISAFRPNA
jgi:Gpi18-like mannosyltransferase